MSTDNFDITIDISKSDSGRTFNGNEVIQVEAKNKFIELLSKLVPEKIDNSVNNDDENSNTRVHNTILIDGKRGYGKTSFIYSVLEELKENKKLAKDVGILRVIDPTITESKEHFLITIISMIDKKLCSTIKNMNDHDMVRTYQKKQDAIASGLTALDSVGKNLFETWSDPKIILSEGIKKNRGALALIDSFHDYIKFALDKLGKTAFLLVFDDIDTSIDKGRLILELLRKYLTSPHLIVVILGDVSIFNLISQEIQWKKISPVLTKKYNESAIPSLYYDEINKLSDQYLMKILNPQNRIRLKLLQEINSNNPSAIKIKNDTQNPTLDTYITKFCQNVFGETNNYSIISIYKNFILSQPLRTIVSLFANYQNNNKSIDPDILTYNFISVISNSHFPNQLEEVMSKYQTLMTEDLDFEIANYLSKINTASNDVNNVNNIDTSNIANIKYISNDLKPIIIILSSYFSCYTKGKSNLLSIIKIALFYTYISTNKKNSSESLTKNNSHSDFTVNQLISFIGGADIQVKSDSSGIMRIARSKIAHIIDSDLNDRLLNYMINKIGVESIGTYGDTYFYCSIWKLLIDVCDYLNTISRTDFFPNDPDNSNYEILEINKAMKKWRESCGDIKFSLRLVSYTASRISSSLLKLKTMQSSKNLLEFFQRTIVCIINELIIMGLDGEGRVFSYSQFSVDASNINRNLTLYNKENKEQKFILEFIKCPIFSLLITDFDSLSWGHNWNIKQNILANFQQNLVKIDISNANVENKRENGVINDEGKIIKTYDAYYELVKPQLSSEEEQEFESIIQATNHKDNKKLKEFIKKTCNEHGFDVMMGSFILSFNRKI